VRSSFAKKNMGVKRRSREKIIRRVLIPSEMRLNCLEDVGRENRTLSGFGRGRTGWDDE